MVWHDGALHLIPAPGDPWREYPGVIEDAFEVLAASRYCLIHYLPPSYARHLTRDEKEALIDCRDDFGKLMQVWPPIKDRIDKIYGTTP